MIRIGKDSIIIVSLFFICFFGFYNFHINIYTMCLLVSIFNFFIKNQKISKEILFKNQWGFIIFIIMLFFATITSCDKYSSLKYFIMFCALFLCAYLSVNKKNNKICQIFIIFCWIEVICILLQSVGVGFIDTFNEYVLPNEMLKSMNNNINVTGSFSGIAGDLPNIMFFSTMIFMYYFICYIKKYDKKYIVYAILGLISIFLCGKRSGIVILAISLFLIYFLNMYVEKKINIKLLIALIFFCLIALYLLYFTNMGDLILNKNNVLQKNGDASNGRIDLIKQMIIIFKRSPIFGIGTLATNKYYGSVLGHNIYFQILSENGIVGFLALLYMLFNNFVYSIKRLKRIKYDEIKIDCLFAIAVQIFFIIYGCFGNPLYGTVFLIPYIVFSEMNIKLYLLENKLERIEEKE